jgi:predicted metal-binding membrane protein
MTSDARELARVRNPVLLISAAAWILLLVEHRSMHMCAHCPMNPPASLAADWVLMLAAMMSPVLIPPVRHIRLRSFTHRRARSIVLFVAGYAAIWMTLGGLLLAIELAVKPSARPAFLPAAGVVFVALVWQFSPVKQRCLNRCHTHGPLAAFGAAADRAALRFGVTHGTWCAGSCWALMLFPMLLPRGQVVAMAGAAILIFSERLEQPGPPGWRWRGLGKLRRLVVAQARIRLHLLTDIR